REYIFERRGDDLWIAGEHEQRCRDMPPGAAVGSVASLQVVPPPAILDTLCAHDWVKEDAFDLFDEPFTIHFNRDLRCQMLFRDGDCRQSGRFSIDGRRLIYEQQAPPCGDLRGGPGARGSDVAFVGPALALNGHRYLPAGSDRSTRRSPALCGNGSLCIDLSYGGDLRYRRSPMLRL